MFCVNLLLRYGYVLIGVRLGTNSTFCVLRENSFSLMRIVRSICIFHYFIMCLPNKLSPKGVLYWGGGWESILMVSGHKIQTSKKECD